MCIVGLSGLVLGFRDEEKSQKLLRCDIVAFCDEEDRLVNAQIFHLLKFQYLQICDNYLKL